jgi:hypothetical protein
MLQKGHNVWPVVELVDGGEGKRELLLDLFPF